MTTRARNLEPLEVTSREWREIQELDKMILEVADIRIRGGEQQAFDEAIQRGLRTVIANAKGYRGHKVVKCIESPERYLLLIRWETLENHTVDFRHSPAFTEWRSIVGPMFALPPVVEHFQVLAETEAWLA